MPPFSPFFNHKTCLRQNPPKKKSDRKRNNILLTEPLFRRFGGSENFPPLPPRRQNGETYMYSGIECNKTIGNNVPEYARIISNS